MDDEDRLFPAKEQWAVEADEEVSEDFYSENRREELVDNDEISAAEAGFMEGAEKRGDFGECPNCGTVLGEDKHTIVELKIDGERIQFCSSDCAKEYKENL